MNVLILFLLFTEAFIFMLCGITTKQNMFNYMSLLFCLLFFLYVFCLVKSKEEK